MKKGLLSSLIFLVLLSCTSTKDPFTANIGIPEQYDSGARKMMLDSMASAQATPPLSWREFFKDSVLHALIDSAVVSNFDVNIAYQRLVQVQSEVQYASGRLVPELGARIGAGVRRFGEFTMDGVGNFDTQFSPNLTDEQQIPDPLPDFYTGVYSHWEIDLWGKLKDRKKAALDRFLASGQGVHLVLTQLVADVAILYTNLQLLDQELVIIEENIALQENALAVVRMQKQAGKETELGIGLLAAQVLDAKNMLLATKMRILELENALNLLLGRYPQKIERSPFSEDLIPSTAIETGIPSDLLQNRPDLKAAYFELRSKNADVRAAKAAFYPSLNINANLGYQAFRSALLFDTPASVAYNLAGGLTAPLLNRRALKAELLLSKASQTEAYLNYERTVVTAFGEVFETVQKTQLLEEMKDLKAQQVRELERSITISKLLFASGRANYLEIITAQENSLTAKLELLEVQAERTQNQVLLFKSLGGGWF
ncbi:efflux transporter outer membrane subunit [Maribacter sp. 2307ULW6-5]|uniref:efflux transporter outer membrane subunit n=1 Tax=Maribacter sp. 2307ULW6-5 TaxID=3386275 RepID=UPI0039BC2F56